MRSDCFISDVSGEQKNPGFIWIPQDVSVALEIVDYSCYLKHLWILLIFSRLFERDYIQHIARIIEININFMFIASYIYVIL